MTKKQLIAKLASSISINRNDAEKIVNTFFSCIKEILVQNKKIEIRGLGTFGIKERKPKLARNLKTGEKIILPTRKVPYFRSGKDLKVIKYE